MTDSERMVEWIRAELIESADVKRRLARESLDGMVQASIAIVETIEQGGKVLLCGNGGSAADAQHLAGELVCRLRLHRSPLPALTLTTNSSIITAWSNDESFETVFAR
jgi:D-sedoheptulose 7-phosphate isomerase